MLTSEQQKIFNVRVPKGGYGYYTLYRGVYDPSNNIDERPTYAETGDLFEPYNSSVVYKATRSGGKTTWAIDENAKRQSETGEGGSGSSLPSMTGKNGKVLGVTLDSEDKEQAEWVTPTGGGAEKFVVTLTESNDTWTADKTVAEIVAADAAGKEVVIVYHAEIADIELRSYYVGSVNIGGGATANGVFASAVYGFEQDYEKGVCVVGAHIQDNDMWMVTDGQLYPNIPEYSSAQNGQVLGVSSGSLAWVDNYAPLIVTMTEDENNSGTYVGDKTFGEVYAAVSAGKTVYIYLMGGYGILNSCHLESGTYTIVGAAEGMMFNGTENDYLTITGN